MNNEQAPFDTLAYSNYKEVININNAALSDEELDRLINLVESMNEYNEDDDEIYFWNVIASKLSQLYR